VVASTLPGGFWFLVSGFWLLVSQTPRETPIVTVTVAVAVN
jgi:hypothetical protein